jgi:hypothetical protein
MLDSVPTGTVALSLPATTIRAFSPGRPQTSCEPRWRKTAQPASVNAARTSRYFFGIAATVRHTKDKQPADPWL